MAERCETCRFWRKINPQPERLAPLPGATHPVTWPNGVCRRYGATRYHPCFGVDNPFPPMGSPWPWTAEDDWCGEWTERKDD